MENQTFQHTVTIETLHDLYMQWTVHKMKEQGYEYIEKQVTWGELGGFIKWAKLSYEESSKQAEKEFEENPLAFIQKAFGNHA